MPRGSTGGIETANHSWQPDDPFRTYFPSVEGFHAFANQFRELAGWLPVTVVAVFYVFLCSMNDFGWGAEVHVGYPKGQHIGILVLAPLETISSPSVGNGVKKWIGVAQSRISKILLPGVEVF